MRYSTRLNARHAALVCGTVLTVCLSGLSADDAKPDLELRTALVSAQICPLDPLELRVEFCNRSDRALVVCIPEVSWSGFLSLEVKTEDGREYASRRTGDVPGSRVQTLQPGECVTTGVLWLGGGSAAPYFTAGRHVVRVRYTKPDRRFFEGESEPTPIESTSEPLTFEVKWCSPAIEEWRGRLNEARYDYDLNQRDEAGQKLRECKQDGPPCIQRAARYIELDEHQRQGDDVASLADCREIWDTATQTVEREVVLGALFRFVQRSGWTDAVADLIGDYVSPVHGKPSEKWKTWKEPIPPRSPETDAPPRIEEPRRAVEPQAAAEVTPAAANPGSAPPETSSSWTARSLGPWTLGAIAVAAMIAALGLIVLLRHRKQRG